MGSGSRHEDENYLAGKGRGITQIHIIILVASNNLHVLGIVWIWILYSKHVSPTILDNFFYKYYFRQFVYVFLFKIKWNIVILTMIWLLYWLGRPKAANVCDVLVENTTRLNFQGIKERKQNYETIFYFFWLGKIVKPTISSNYEEAHIFLGRPT